MSQHPPQLPPQWPPGHPYPPAPAAQIAYQTVSRPVLERDRRGGLVAFGIVSLLIGALAGCGTLLMPLSLIGLAFAPGAALPEGLILQLIISTLIYGAAATVFIWTGIGSIRCKRWVRPIVISLGWPTIIMGVLGLVGWALFARDLPAFMAAAATVTPPPAPGAPPMPPPAPPPPAAPIAAFVAVVM